MQQLAAKVATITIWPLPSPPGLTSVQTSSNQSSPSNVERPSVVAASPRLPGAQAQQSQLGRSGTNIEPHGTNDVSVQCELGIVLPPQLLEEIMAGMAKLQQSMSKFDNMIDNATLEAEKSQRNVDQLEQQRSDLAAMPGASKELSTQIEGLIEHARQSHEIANDTVREAEAGREVLQKEGLQMIGMLTQTYVAQALHQDEHDIDDNCAVFEQSFCCVQIQRQH